MIRVIHNWLFPRRSVSYRSTLLSGVQAFAQALAVGVGTSVSRPVAMSIRKRERSLEPGSVTRLNATVLPSGERRLEGFLAAYDLITVVEPSAIEIRVNSKVCLDSSYRFVKTKRLSGVQPERYSSPP